MVSSKYSHDPSINFTPQKYCFFLNYANICIKKCRFHEKPALFWDTGILVYRTTDDYCLTTRVRLLYSCTLGVEEFLTAVNRPNSARCESVQ